LSVAACGSFPFIARRITMWRAMQFRHKNMRLNPSQYKGQRSYFVTLCCERRRRVFANGRNADWIIDILRQLSASFKFAVYAYCIMPDHFHLLLTGTDPICDLLQFVADFKEITTRQYRENGNQSLWQKKLYDHVLRQGESRDAVAGYIWMNPVRAGLCTAPHEYPYSGSFVIDWKKGFLPIELWTPEWRNKTKHPAKPKLAAT